MSAYYGTYRIDSAQQTITHVVQGAMSPDWIGSELVSGYQFLAPNRIELRVLITAEANAVDGTRLV